MANGDQTRVELQDDSDADIREADRAMRGWGAVERLRRDPTKLQYWVHSPVERDEAHQEMQRAAERGMTLRRGRTQARELKSRLEGVLKDEPAPARRKRSGSKRD